MRKWLPLVLVMLGLFLFFAPLPLEVLPSASLSCPYQYPCGTSVSWTPLAEGEAIHVRVMVQVNPTKITVNSGKCVVTDANGNSVASFALNYEGDVPNVGDATHVFQWWGANWVKPHTTTKVKFEFFVYGTYVGSSDTVTSRDVRWGCSDTNLPNGYLTLNGESLRTLELLEVGDSVLNAGFVQTKEGQTSSNMLNHCRIQIIDDAHNTINLQLNASNSWIDSIELPHEGVYLVKVYINTQDGSNYKILDTLVLYKKAEPPISEPVFPPSPPPEEEPFSLSLQQMGGIVMMAAGGLLYMRGRKVNYP